jgi:hypothetical protein
MFFYNYYLIKLIITILFYIIFLLPFILANTKVKRLRMRKVFGKARENHTNFEKSSVGILKFLNFPQSR